MSEQGTSDGSEYIIASGRPTNGQSNQRRKSDNELDVRCTEMRCAREEETWDGEPTTRDVSRHTVRQ
uniref:Uncharacterized protein n=1 Tax=Pristionchus pacificus TaxID=54126 RepID=A0A2A6BUB4_PRIPA|eukprot:PDM69495.1 hypothetical protein PRIPAC_44591 [Pristionchus pacificus]